MATLAHLITEGHPTVGGGCICSWSWDDNQLAYGSPSGLTVIDMPTPYDADPHPQRPILRQPFKSQERSCTGKVNVPDVESHYVTRTGDTQQIFAFPFDACTIRSPDGRDALQSRPEPTTLSLWRLADNTLVFEVPYRPEWMPCSFTWIQRYAIHD